MPGLATASQTNEHKPLTTVSREKFHSTFCRSTLLIPVCQSRDDANNYIHFICRISPSSLKTLSGYLGIGQAAPAWGTTPLRRWTTELPVSLGDANSRGRLIPLRLSPPQSEGTCGWHRSHRGMTQQCHYHSPKGRTSLGLNAVIQHSHNLPKL